MTNRGLENVGKEAFQVLEEYLEEEKKRKTQLQSYVYHYGKRHSDYYYVAKPVQSNIPQLKRQPLVIIDNDEAAKKYGGVIFARKQEIRKPSHLVSYASLYHYNSSYM